MPDNESHSEFDPEFRESRSELINKMQQVAPPGQRQLDSATIENLRGFTFDLLAAERSVAAAEYDRFRSVEQRGLNLDTTKLQEQLSSKTILVTGGTGCIGSKLIEQLTELNPGRIVSISRGITKPWRIKSGVEYEKADIRDKQKLEVRFREVRPDIVYHLAAQRDPGLAESSVAYTLATNITGTFNVIEAVKRSDTPQLVYASTGKAVRPFTRDTYAASKKIAEVLMANAAQSSDALCSGARFTHVVDNSIIHQRLQNWISTNTPIRLHAQNIFFYMQSARESANLLLNAGLNARESKFDIHTIRDLGLPINLVDLALGAISRSHSMSPIYFCGFESGYKKEAYPALYDPSLSGGVSPLINGFEASQTDSSETCIQVDRFPFLVATNDIFVQKLHMLELACKEGASDDILHRIKDELSLTILDARLRKVPIESLQRTARHMDTLSSIQPMNEEDTRINSAVYTALRERQ